MKLIIQIPCYNEEGTLAQTLAALPKQLPGIDVLEWLIINDGSRDRTVEVARAAGVHHIVSFSANQGLARAFAAGLDACLKEGADIIVNTDADNQYCAEDIPKLLAPILAGQAEIVIGERPVAEIKEWSPMKRALQRLGSWVVRVASQTSIPDAPSGFRAITRHAAMRLNVFDDYTYTLETIIQAGHKNIPITSVPIRTNPTTRPSRLIKSIPRYIARSIHTIFRIFMVYRPFRFFFLLGSPFVAAGSLLFARWLYLHLYVDSGRAYTPSLMLGAVCLLLGLQLWIIGLVAELLATNRRLLEDIQMRTRTLETAALSRDRRAP